MKRKKGFFCIIVLIIIAIIIGIVANANRENLKNIYYEVKKQLYGDPIDIETGMINNSFFDIFSDGSNATRTRKGINEAIEYASTNNIEYIKLQKGNYLVDSFVYEINGNKYDRSIIVKSNIKFDLNGSTIKIQRNNNPNYRILSILDEQNIEIMNGIVVGDRYEHDYTIVDEITKKHQWGMGVSILGGKNIHVHNLEILDTTGDGIYISKTQNKDAENITISNCNIHNTRRQGITIITAFKVKIFENEIHNINGSPPQSGIDIERNNESQISDEIYIYQNKIYSLASKDAIIIYEGVTNTKIYENDINGKISIKYPNDTIVEYDNNISL